MILCQLDIWVVSESVKKCGVCAVMSLWLVHIKNMCGTLEYAQPPYFYLPSVGVATTDILSNWKASAWGLSTDLSDDDDNELHYANKIYDSLHSEKVWWSGKKWFFTISTLGGCGVLKGLVLINLALGVVCWLERTDFGWFLLLGMWFSWKEWLWSISTLRGCGGLEKTDFQLFPPWEDMVVLKGLFQLFQLWEYVVILRKLVCGNYKFEMWCLKRPGFG